jgi:molybdenum cofactor guanylyltransferase
VRTGIVLAGGRSERFGADKLAEPSAGGRSLLTTAISALAGIVEGVIVAGPELPSDLREALDDSTPIAVVRDPEPYGGPLAGLANVLASAEPAAGDVAVLVGGDMPGLVPAVLRAMLDRLDADTSIDAVILAGPQAAPAAPRQVLPMALRVASAALPARAAIAEGRRSLQSLLDRLRWTELPAGEWLALDPGARTLLDVDTPADLDRLRSGKER